MDVDLDQRLDGKASPVSDHVQHSTKSRGLVVLSRKSTISFVSNKSAKITACSNFPVELRMCMWEQCTAIGVECASQNSAYPRKYNATKPVGKAGANRKAIIVLAILA